jgi:DEAD/DEAH box helicase domain-containing protein
VLVTHLFATPYNGDRKLLAFTDSVQDASHHAAFFGARTWRFGVRAALQGLLQGPDDAPSLDDLGARLLARAAAESPSLHDRIARWLPTDLVDLPEALRHRDRPDDAARQEALWARIAVRLSWEIVQEYGLGARSLGRTLERTGCSTAAPDADDVTRATRALVADIRAQKMLGPRSDEVDEDDVRHLLDALLDRLRVRGGVFHPLLDRYVEDGANRFLLSKRRQPLLSPFARGVRPPSFLQGVVHSEGFESFAPVQATETSWHRDLARRVFRLPVAMIDGREAVQAGDDAPRGRGGAGGAPRRQGLGVGLLPAGAAGHRRGRRGALREMPGDHPDGRPDGRTHGRAGVPAYGLRRAA